VLKDANKKVKEVKEQSAIETKTVYSTTIFEDVTVSHYSLEAMNIWKALSDEEKREVNRENREVLRLKEEAKLYKAKAEYESAMAAVDETTWSSMLKTIVG